MKRKPVVGETLYLVKRLYNGRRVPDDKLKPERVRVSKVGRKYFTIDKLSGTYVFHEEYRLEDWREHTPFSSDAQLFANLDEYEGAVEHEKLWGEFRNLFNQAGRNKLTLHQLRKIRDVIAYP